VQADRKTYDGYRSLASAAFNHGDIDGAIKLMNAADHYLPNGENTTYKQTDGGIIAEHTDQNGNTTQSPMSTQDFAKLLRHSQAGQFDHMVQQGTANSIGKINGGEGDRVRSPYTGKGAPFGKNMSAAQREQTGFGDVAKPGQNWGKPTNVIRAGRGMVYNIPAGQPYGPGSKEAEGQVGRNITARFNEAERARAVRQSPEFEIKEKEATAKAGQQDRMDQRVQKQEEGKDRRATGTAERQAARDASTGARNDRQTRLRYLSDQQKVRDLTKEEAAEAERLSHPIAPRRQSGGAKVAPPPANAPVGFEYMGWVKGPDGKYHKKG
jgi:hypothetical protein